MQQIRTDSSVHSTYPRVFVPMHCSRSDHVGICQGCAAAVLPCQPRVCQSQRLKWTCACFIPFSCSICRKSQTGQMPAEKKGNQGWAGSSCVDLVQCSDSSARRDCVMPPWRCSNCACSSTTSSNTARNCKSAPGNSLSQLLASSSHV